MSGARGPGCAVGLVAALSIATSIGCSGPADPGQARASEDEVAVTIREVRIVAEVVRTRDEQALGLGERNALAWGRGMLFVYPEPRVLGFWMKNMRFAIDMVWIREGRIRQIHHRVPAPGASGPAAPIPDSELRLYRPSELIDRVLEVPAGQAAAAGWRTGDVVEIEPDHTP